MISTRPVVAPPPQRSSHASSSTTVRRTEPVAPAKVQVKSDKGKLTDLWGSPPIIIVRDQSASLTRGDLLGEGGFARVYLATEKDGTQKAVKVIAKEQLKSSKTKGKLFGEIKIHQAMKHANIIGFEHCFEDDGNVYMQLELCANGSMLDLLRRRKRYSEPEARYYLVQLIGACEYMHSNSVIHRDLKLGNLMLDEDMNLRVGDFGLAALVKFPGERKKTICGTPNYIAPEILFDTTNGHSFEVDIWSIGVILYTLLVGKPPFQTKDVKNIYKKIKENNYEFPAELELSTESVDLISKILTTKPDERPTLNEILAHDFFTCGPFPASISNSTMSAIPDYRRVSIRASLRNFAQVKADSGIVEVDILEAKLLGVILEDAPPAVEKGDQIVIDKEVNKALQPGSPISELLRSARKPLMVSPSAQPRALIQRKLVAEARVEAGSTNMRVSKSTSQMMGEMVISSRETKENDEIKLARRSSKLMATEKHSGSEKLIMGSKRGDVQSAVEPTITRHPARQLYESSWRALDTGLNATSSSQLQDLAISSLSTPKVFIMSWVDYTHKYGTAYTLTDGTAGLSFNDSTTMVLSPGGLQLDYISNRTGNIYSRRHYTLPIKHESDPSKIKVKGDFPPELDRKVYLTEYFKDYMGKTLTRDLPWAFVDEERLVNMEFLVKYYRMKHAIVFKMSNEVLQFNFYDHTKLLLTENGLVVTFIERGSLATYSIYNLFKEAGRLGYNRGPLSEPLDSKKSKKLEDLLFIIKKLEYCRDVLRTLSSRKSSPIASETTLV